MDKALQKKFPIYESDTVIGDQYHTYTPFSSSYNNNDEIRIAIQAQDLYVLPSESYLVVEIQTTGIADVNIPASNAVTFARAFLLHLFSEMRYEMRIFHFS